jgi:hypothetical protein
MIPFTVYYYPFKLMESPKQNLDWAEVTKSKTYTLDHLSRLYQ